jgi:hypothetical protein
LMGEGNPAERSRRLRAAAERHTVRQTGTCTVGWVTWTLSLES